MTQRNWSWEAKQMLPHLVGLMGKGVTVQSAGGNLVAHALGSGWHTGTLDESQAPWATTDSEFTSHTGSADAHHARLHGLDSTSDHQGTLSWVKVDKTGASLVDLPTRLYSDLQSRTHHILTEHSYAGGAALDVFGLSGANTLAKLTPSSDVSAESSGGSILRSNGAGALTVKNLTASVGVRTALLDTASGDMTLSPAGDLVLNPGGADVILTNGDSFRSSNYLAGFPLAGFRLGPTAISGQYGMELGVLQADELRARIFVSDETRVDRGQEYITRSYGILSRSMAIPAAIDGSVYLYVENSPNVAGRIFAEGDWVLFQHLDISSGIVLTSFWGQVYNYYTTGLIGEQRHSFYLRSGSTSSGVTVAKGAMAVNFGASGQGYILSDAVSPTAPAISIGKWVTNPYTPANRTVYAMVGKLDGVGFAGEAGLAATVDNFTAAGRYVKVGTGGARFNNVDAEWWTGGSKFAWVNATDGFNAELSTAYATERGFSFFSGGGAVERGGLYAAMAATAGSPAYLMLGTGPAPNNDGRPTWVHILANHGGVGTHGRVILDAWSQTGGQLTLTLLPATKTVEIAGALAVTGTANPALTVTQGVSAQSFTATGASVLPVVNYSGGVQLQYNGATKLQTTSTGASLTGALGVSTTLSVTDWASFEGGNIALNYTTPERGLGIKALPASTWAWGMHYLNSASALLGGFGAYGTADALSYFYIGNAFNDYSLRVDPATDRVGIGNAVAPAYTLDVSGDVNAGGSYRRDGYAGSIYIAVPSKTLTDTGGGAWGGATKAVGTYYFDMQDAANGFPAETKAVCVMFQGNWAATSNANYAYVQTPGQTLCAVIRAHTLYTQETQAIVALDANGQFQCIIGGLQMTGSLMRIVGYFM